MSTYRAALVLILCISPLLGQRGTTEARGTLGYATFLDEGDESHLLAGGSVRFYLTDRFSIEPELLYLYKDEGDKDILFLSNVAWDFGREGSRVRPYAIGGVGVIHGIRSRFSTTELTFSGGIGAKIFINDRWFIAPEGRLGWEPILRLNVSIGYRF